MEATQLYALKELAANKTLLEALAAVCDEQAAYHAEKCKSAVRGGELREAERHLHYADCWGGLLATILEEAAK